ncbi:MAG TPA: hypothetical protein VMU39_15095 [Solirubrobacteraceae bacterium]|nr:hypothetical protein [Solirubrobacteraceae bacterium]
MADGLNDRPEIVRASDDHAAPARLGSAVKLGRRGGLPREHSPHSHKFRVAIALLVGIAIGAIVVALAALGGSDKATANFAWSAWKPPDTSTQGAREIADHIAPTYRISAVNQLDVVTVVNLSSPSANTSTSGSPGGLQVAVRQDPTTSQVSLLGGDTIAYNLCGIGTTNCAIGTGTPSAERLLLLKREALELALYTLKYVHGVQNVVAILPPGHTVQTSTLTRKPPSPNAKSTSKPVDIALLFLRGELKPWLDRPLSDTFPEQFPPMVPELGRWSQTEEAGLVSQIAASGLFTEKLVQAQDGSNLIVLDPQPPQ